MTMQVTAHTYHLRYVPDEDRVLLSVDIDPENELGMLLTRSLIRNLLTALAKLVGEKTLAGSRAAAAPTPSARDTVLDFEHSQSVADAVAQGAMRNEPREEIETREKTKVAPETLVREVKIVPKQEGGLALVFDNKAQLLALEVAPERIHMVIETFLQIAERAGWDFPPVAGWLSPAGKAVVTSAGKTLN